MTEKEYIERESVLEIINSYGLANGSTLGRHSGIADVIAERVQDIPAANVVVLPCKVGDTVYRIQNNAVACHDCEHYSDFYGMDAMCSKDKDYISYPQLSNTPICEKHFYEIVEWAATIEWLVRHRGEFGKTVFLTREEAEAALAKMEV